MALELAILRVLTMVTKRGLIQCEKKARAKDTSSAEPMEEAWVER
jgi:hypothetical protein